MLFGQFENGIPAGMRIYPSGVGDDFNPFFSDILDAVGHNDIDEIGRVSHVRPFGHGPRQEGHSHFCQVIQNYIIDVSTANQLRN